MDIKTQTDLVIEPTTNGVIVRENNNDPGQRGLLKAAETYVFNDFDELCEFLQKHLLRGEDTNGH